MRIAIVSDTHNNMANFKKAIDWIKKDPPLGEAGKISMILHCGDISSQETIAEAKKYFSASADSSGETKGGTIHFVKGNADFELDDIPEKMELEVGNKKIAFCHFPNEAKKMAQSGKYDIVFYGHTHRPWDEKVGKTHMINPGELAGQFYKPTFAVYDTETEELELKILEKL